MVSCAVRGEENRAGPGVLRGRSGVQGWRVRVGGRGRVEQGAEGAGSSVRQRRKEGERKEGEKKKKGKERKREGAGFAASPTLDRPHAAPGRA